MAGRPARKAARQEAARKASTRGVESLRSPLLVGRSVSNAPVYKGKRNPPSEATVAKRAAEARLAARSTCGSCFTKFTPAGTCSC